MSKKGVQNLSKIQNSDFCQKCETFFRIFHCSLANLKRTAKRPTVLSSLLKMLTILITFRKIYFLNNFFIFCRGCITFFRKMAENVKLICVLMIYVWPGGFLAEDCALRGKN